MTRNRRYDLLVVDPEPETVSPLIEAFEATDRTNEIYVVNNGDSALDFIHRKGEYADVPRPDLILLDLDLSGRSGTEILTELKEQPELQRVPVIVVTASDSADDISRLYGEYANAFVPKPTTASEFETLAEAIEGFWLKSAHLPPK